MGCNKQIQFYESSNFFFVKHIFIFLCQECGATFSREVDKRRQAKNDKVPDSLKKIEK
jgi:hypothetical protein